MATLKRNQVWTHKRSPPVVQSIHRKPAAAGPAHTSSTGLMDFPVVTPLPSASDAQHAQRRGEKGLTLGLYIQRQENQYLSPKDRSKDAGVPKHSQSLGGTAARTGVTRGRHKQGHGLMQIPGPAAQRRMKECQLQKVELKVKKGLHCLRKGSEKKKSQKLTFE